MTLPMFREFECDCERCSMMCQAPCCGTPQEMQAIIDAGMGDRLMFDGYPDGNAALLKPALTGYEGEFAPYETASREGCTFWVKGKCQLHDKGLKPVLGRLAYHDSVISDYDTAVPYVNESWDTDEADKLIEEWQERHLDDRTLNFLNYTLGF